MLASASVRELQQGIRDGEVTRREIVETHLARVNQVNPLTNSFVELRADEVLREAGRADAAHGTTIAGSLDGIPMSVKDSYSVAGLRRSDGLVINRDRRAGKDELVVERLRGSGALILGHAAIPDLCIRWNTISSLYGVTHNPRDLSRTAGGSSGGDAANVAAGLATVGLGGDLGGSIRVPASFCGFYGFRPGLGRVPNVTELPFAPPSPGVELMATIGPLARTVADIDVSFRAITGANLRDPATMDVPLTESAAKPRVAVLRYETGAVLDAEINARLDGTITALRAEGYDVVEGVFPELRRAPEVWAEILGTDLLQLTLPALGKHVIESGRVHIQEMFGAFDLGSEVRPYQNAWLERRSLQDRLSAFMLEYPLVVAPVAGMLAPRINYDDFIGVDASAALFDQMRCVPWVILFNLPSLALPSGIQLVGRRFAELDVIRAGYAVERHLPDVTVANPA